MVKLTKSGYVVHESESVFESNPQFAAIVYRRGYHPYSKLLSKHFKGITAYEIAHQFYVWGNCIVSSVYLDRYLKSKEERTVEMDMYLRDFMRARLGSWFPITIAERTISATVTLIMITSLIFVIFFGLFMAEKVHANEIVIKLYANGQKVTGTHYISGAYFVHGLDSAMEPPTHNFSILDGDIYIPAKDYFDLGYGNIDLYLYIASIVPFDLNQDGIFDLKDIMQALHQVSE